MQLLIPVPGSGNIIDIQIKFQDEMEVVYSIS
jgi:hypothetical protein